MEDFSEWFDLVATYPNITKKNTRLPEAAVLHNFMFLLQDSWLTPDSDSSSKRR